MRLMPTKRRRTTNEEVDIRSSGGFHARRRFQDFNACRRCGFYGFFSRYGPGRFTADPARDECFCPSRRVFCRGSWFVVSRSHGGVLLNFNNEYVCSLDKRQDATRFPEGNMKQYLASALRWFFLGLVLLATAVFFLKLTNLARAGKVPEAITGVFRL